jgi:hypothetical protein
MVNGIRAVLILAVATAAVRGLNAQELDLLCRSAAHVAVGQWASYTRGGRDNGAQVRFAIVGSEHRGDSTFYWFEIKSSGAATSNGVLQILVPGFGAEMVGVHAMILQQGSQPPMRFPDQMVSMLGAQVGQNNPTLGIVLHCATARIIGWETVQLPSGPVHALHVADPEGMEAWRVPDVPFGFVQVRLKDGSMMTLNGHGAGATSSLVGMP